MTESLKKLECRTLIFVGGNSPFHAESIHMTSKLDPRYSALVEVTSIYILIWELNCISILVKDENFIILYTSQAVSAKSNK